MTNNYPRLSENAVAALPEGLVYVGIGREEVFKYHPLFAYSVTARAWEIANPPKEGMLLAAIRGTECAKRYGVIADGDGFPIPHAFKKCIIEGTLKDIERELGSYCLDTGYHPKEWEKRQNKFPTVSNFHGKTMYEMGLILTNLLFFMDSHGVETAILHPGNVVTNSTDSVIVTVADIMFELRNL
jgi:hypothetical protein